MLKTSLSKKFIGLSLLVGAVLLSPGKGYAGAVGEYAIKACSEKEMSSLSSQLFQCSDGPKIDFIFIVRDTKIVHYDCGVGQPHGPYLIPSTPICYAAWGNQGRIYYNPSAVCLLTAVGTKNC